MTDETPEPTLNALTAEAVKKAQIAWVAVGSGPSVCLWCLWIDDALYVVCGPGEQRDPGLAAADDCRVTLRGDHLGRIVDFRAIVTPVTADDDNWDDVATALAAKRLNAAGEDTVARWARECAVYRLAPVDEPPLSGSDLPSGSLAAVPVPSEAARPTRKPFRLHKVKRKRR